MKHVKQSWVNLALFPREEDARALQRLLQNHGYESRTYDDHLFRLFLFLRPPHETFRTQVQKDDLESALQLISDDPSAAGILQRAIQCPSCGSLNIQYPQMTRKFFTPTVVLHLGILLRLIEHKAYCWECHYVWALSEFRDSAPTRTGAVSHQHH